MSDGLQVLVVASKFPPHAGGTAVVWREWCKYWPGSAVRVIAPSTPGCVEFDRQQNYTVRRVRYPDIPKLRMPLLWLLLGLRCLLECLIHRPGVVHFQHVFENGFIGPILRLALGQRYWVHVYAEELALARRHRWLHRAVLTVIRHADGVTAISGYTASLLKEMGYSGPCLLVHPAVDCTFFAKNEEHSSVRPEGLRLLTVGRLMQRKGHERVLRMLPRLRAHFPGLTYVIVGIGPEEARLRELSRQLELDHCVEFRGKTTDEEIVALMNQSDIFVHPNIVTNRDDIEGFGIVFLEAAACELVTVGGRNGGTLDSVMDAETGYLVGHDDEELFQRLLELLSDPNLRTKMGQAGRRFASSFSWDWAASRVWEQASS